MTGGIYCEVPLGTIYEERVLGSVTSRMKKLLGTTAGLPDKALLNQQIINYWYNDVSDKMGKILSSWSVPGNRGYYNRTVDLTRSICLGVYYKGKLHRMYRFTGGRRERGLFTPSDMGSNSSPSATYRMEMLGKSNHPDPADRARRFLEDYQLHYKTGFSLVIAATMPYAVRLESTGGYGLPVLSKVVNRMLTSVYEFKEGGVGFQSNAIKTGSPIYGYIFESTGNFEA